MSHRRPPQYVHPRGAGGVQRDPLYSPGNPNLNGYGNPQSQGYLPVFPPNPYQNPIFAQVPGTYLQNPAFAPPNPYADPNTLIQIVDAAATKAHRELVAAGQSVSTWKASQAALRALNIESWSSLGFQIQDVPSLHNLIITEGKINAFIHCFLGARRITSLYDLEVAICKNEGVERFEELSLGPLLHHPLIEHYFSVSPDVTEIFKITTEEIIHLLQNFMKKSKKILVEKFLEFLEEKKLVSKEKLCVRIQSLGLHIYYIRGAMKAEKEAINQACDSIKQSTTQPRMDSSQSQNITSQSRMDSAQSQNILSEKKILDGRFDLIANRINTFASEWDDFSGKHIRFNSPDSDAASDDEIDDDEDSKNDSELMCKTQTFYSRDNGKRVSTCPYPSTTEEMVRLGLKIDSTEKLIPENTTSMKSRCNKSCGKKRKAEEEKGNSSYKLQKYDIIRSRIQKLNSIEFEKFITTWKEACREHSLAEVLDMMVNFYAPYQKKKIKKILSSYPAIGLIGIAIMSIKHGAVDSIYDTFQAFGQSELSNPSSAFSTEMINVGPTNKENARLNVSESFDSVTVDDIVKKIADYMELETINGSKRDLHTGKLLWSLKKLCYCERWLLTHFSAKEFSTLGYGNFLDFLERYASLLPRELYENFDEGSSGLCSMYVSLCEQQLSGLISLANYNWMEDGVRTKNDVFSLLSKQFPTANFILGSDFGNCISNLKTFQKDNDGPGCVLFSAALLGKRWTSLECPEKYSSPATASIDQQNCALLTSAFENVTDCLLAAPMLSDLLSWSHWDLIYAPSFGPLIEWLLNEAQTKELLCVVTKDGKVIKVDPSATVDKFLEDLIQLSPSRAALSLLSLISLYRGTCHAPVALIKCYAQRAMEVVIRNFIDSSEMESAKESPIDTSSLRDLSASVEDFNMGLCPGDFLASSQSRQDGMISQHISKVNNAFAVLARFILDCLGLLPPEFGSFAADILFSGLQFFTRHAPLIILNQCNQSSQRSMLHDIGLTLRVTEWVQDYHDFNSSAATDRRISQPDSYSLGSESVIDGRHVPESAVNPSINNNVASLNINSDVIFPDKGSESFTGGKEDCVKLHHGFHKRLKGELSMEIASHVVNEKSGMSNYKQIHEATLVIEEIRREEFGLGQNLTDNESFLLKKQHARLGRALHCLSQELYSQDSHLLLELVQNADDNVYSHSVEPTLVFILQETGIVVLNNEVGFSADNIRALCDIGNSTKKGEAAGYIGHKGIGFKSVFRVTDAPEIHSNGFHVKFDITEGQIGFVLPTIVSPCDIAMFGQMLYEGGPQVSCTSWNTCIILPFRSKVAKEATMSSIITMFSDLHPSLLLFLHRLRCIRFKNVLNNTSLVMRRETMGNGIVKVSHRNETMSWLVVNKRLQANVIRHGVQSTEIAVAFTLQESEPGEYTPFLVQQPVFAFLPLRNYGLKFIIQGDFILPSSREEVDGDSAWNQWLLSEFPALFVDAEQSFCSLPCYNENLGKAVTAYMSFIPLIGEVHGFFSHLPYMIISKLRMSNCLLLDSNSLDWVLPCRTLRGWDELARITLPDSLLQKHLGFGYLNKDIILSDTLAKALGVQDYGPKVLIDFISSLCRSSDGIKLMGLDWLSSWFIVLHSILSSPSIHSTANSRMESNLINTLRKLPVIPLSDGSYGSTSDGLIWLPCDISSDGFEGKQYQSYFPRLYDKLRIVNPLFFSATMITNCLEEKKVSYLIQMLERLGVQQLSAHEVIKSHILVAFSDKNENTEVEDRSWMIEYMSFIMVHFQFSCSSCHLEKEDIITELCTRFLLLTNDGYRCPAREPIHFSKEYGNPVDIGKLIGKLNLQWLEVDAAYLKHPSTHLLSSAPKVWREFLKELGITDFVQVNCTKKHGTDILLSAGTVLDKEHLIETSFISDWESAELDHMLATFSFKKCRDKCIYLLEILDKMWDNCYSAKAKSFLFSETTGHRRPIISTFMKNICKIGWIASSSDCELHEAKDLFYDCEDVRSILGDMAPYAVPQLASNFFLKEIGFKTQVSHDDALRILTNWRMSKSSSCTSLSVSQMSKFYSFISEGVAASRMHITKEFISNHFIFVPFIDTKAAGTFVSSKDVFWNDPTGCFDKIREMLQCGQRVEVDSLPCQCLSSVYPGLHDFFVQVCNVPEVPPFSAYLQLLQLLSSVALPSHAAQAVFHVFLKWCNDIKSGLVNSEEIIHLKSNLTKLESKVLPTMLDKWVSLHPSFGIICWADDDNLKQQFIHSKGIDFLQFGQLDHEEKEMLSGEVAVLLKKLGIPSISEIVSQEAIFYGTGDSRGMMFLINRILRYAQRYIYKLYPDIYLRLKQTGFEKLNQLQVVVVEKLFYKHSLKGCDATSNKRVECSCLLQGNILYATNTLDSHSIFLELSRFFFDGSTELHFANFLHMIVTMEESGSSIEQIEFFIINSQKVPILPDEEPMWNLSLMTDELNFDSILPKSTPCLNVHQNASTSRRKPGIIPNWPPTDWKTAPRTKLSISLRQGFGSYAACETESNNSLGVTEQAEILSECIEVEDWFVEAGLPSENTSSLQDSKIINKQPLLVDSSDSISMLNSGLESKNQLVDPSGPDLSFKYLSAFPETDNIHSQALNDPITWMTGRVGEAIAYNYLTTKLGPNMVRWVNEQTETGLPYDIIIGGNEYIEVKTTRYASKNWFEITMREWQFAAEMGDSFNIAHVVLSDDKKASITMFKNPLKLCQQHALQLALFMSRQIRDTAVSS